MDDVNIGTIAVNDADLSLLSGSLIFSGADFGVILFGVDANYSYIKLNDNVWTFSEQTGSTTTNSEAVVSTLNSTVSTEAMWVGDVYEQNEIIYKGKIFVTDQDPYSINDGVYNERTRTTEYKIHE